MGSLLGADQGSWCRAETQPRDFKTEYRRRVQRGLAKGLSRSQARGHRPAQSKHTSPIGRERELSDARLQFALRTLRKEKSLTRAAKEVRISPERLKRIALEKGVIEQKKGRRWTLRPGLPRQVLIYSRVRSELVPNRLRWSLAICSLRWAIWA